MTYETKVLLSAMASIMRKSNSLEDAYEELEEMANVEGVILKPFKKEGKIKKEEET